jgi:signal transduction histidine kinase
LFLRFKKYVNIYTEDANLPAILLKQDLPTEQILSPTQALHLFRMLQEGLQNAVKHSQASKIEALFE